MLEGSLGKSPFFVGGLAESLPELDREARGAVGMTAFLVKWDYNKLTGGGWNGTGNLIRLRWWSKIRSNS